MLGHSDFTCPTSLLHAAGNRHHYINHQDLHHHHHHHQDQDTVYLFSETSLGIVAFFLWACDAKYVLKSMCVQFGNALHD